MSAEGKRGWRISILLVVGRDVPKDAIIDWELEEVGRRIRERAKAYAEGRAVEAVRGGAVWQVGTEEASTPLGN